MGNCTGRITGGLFDDDIDPGKYGLDGGNIIGLEYVVEAVVSNKGKVVKWPP